VKTLRALPLLETGFALGAATHHEKR